MTGPFRCQPSVLDYPSPIISHWSAASVGLMGVGEIRLDCLTENLMRQIYHRAKSMGIDNELLNFGVIQSHSKRSFSPEVRDRIARLSNYRCAHCGRRVALSAKSFLMQMNAGHVIAWSRGGPNSYSNLICLCRKCNRFQSDRSFLETWGLLEAFRLNAEALKNGIMFGFY